MVRRRELASGRVAADLAQEACSSGPVAFFFPELVCIGTYLAQRNVVDSVCLWGVAVCSGAVVLCRVAEVTGREVGGSLPELSVAMSPRRVLRSGMWGGVWCAVFFSVAYYTPQN